MKRLLVPDPGQMKRIGVPKPEPADRVEFEWPVWPTPRGEIPDAAFTNGLLAVSSYAKLRPCLVLTPADEIDQFREAHILPISSVKGSEIELTFLRRDLIAHRHFLPGEATMGIEDGEVDFRWSWRLKVAELRFGMHDAELDGATFGRLLQRFCEYLLG